MDSFFSFLASMRWQDFVDIFINSYILFRFYVLFKGTRAFRVLIGVLCLWFFHRIAVSLGLIVTSWAVQGIIAVGALIIIVVFRNEIRSVFQTRSLKAIFWGFPKKITDTPVEIIAESAFEMADKRVGALIVIPGKEDLDEIVHRGLPWHGLVSKDMIKSIFWHDNPVHDGAAIIQDDRIKAVRVVLPLSQRKSLPSYYGMRHRAAAGLAESADALVIVVSEESGDVAVARGSDILPVNRKEALERIMNDHLGLVEDKSAAMKKEKLQTAAAALVSLVFVIGVWFSVARGVDALVTLEIPVEYTNRNLEMEIVEASVDAVRLHLSGPGALIKSIQPNQVGVRLNLAEAVPGRNSFTITNENIKLPPGVTLKKVEPQAVEVALDIPTRKTLPVQVDWIGELPDRLILESKKSPSMP
ncbi:MAG: DNA integrity scanning protein DisA nucleotide-binding domain protein [Deltaproteobacteria bacterium]|nr:DNA integrity scanning protein DisA nucleotide-binding domain protein [Deltaproteobacteria bacterium]